MSDYIDYNDAVQVIKQAILRSQYQAAKGVNAVELELDFAIGGYISKNTRNGVWGTGAIEAISAQLKQELPGLKGFSARSLKYMRTFFEQWVGELGESDISALASAEMQEDDNAIIRHLQVPNWNDETKQAFLSIGFTHHRTILEKVKDLEERLFYIRLCAREKCSVDDLKRFIAEDTFRHQGALPNNFSRALSSSQQALKAISVFKDEYLLDFINEEKRRCC